MSSKKERIRRSEGMVVVTATMPTDLVKKIKEKTKAEDMTVSQYFRSLVRQDLEAAA